jgi:hypothetical protein
MDSPSEMGSRTRLPLYIQRNPVSKFQAAFVDGRFFELKDVAGLVLQTIKAEGPEVPLELDDFPAAVEKDDVDGIKNEKHVHEQGSFPGQDEDEILLPEEHQTRGLPQPRGDKLRFADDGFAPGDDPFHGDILYHETLGWKASPKASPIL